MLTKPNLNILLVCLLRPEQRTDTITMLAEIANARVCDCVAHCREVLLQRLKRHNDSLD